MKEKLRIVEENGKKYLINTHLKTHRFEIVEKIPKTYEVWNIGDNMISPEYIPFAREIGHYCIDGDTLKTIKLSEEDVQILRKAAGWGTTNLSGVAKRLLHPRKRDVSSDILFRAYQILQQITE